MHDNSSNQIYFVRWLDCLVSLSRAVTLHSSSEKNAERCTQGSFSSYQQVRMSCRIHKFAFENYFIVVNSESKRTRLAKIGGQGVLHEPLAVGTVTCIWHHQDFWFQVITKIFGFRTLLTGKFESNFVLVFTIWIPTYWEISMQQWRRVSKRHINSNSHKK